MRLTVIRVLNAIYQLGSIQIYKLIHEEKHRLPSQVISWGPLPLHPLA